MAYCETEKKEGFTIIIFLSLEKILITSRKRKPEPGLKIIRSKGISQYLPMNFFNSFKLILVSLLIIGFSSCDLKDKEIQKNETSKIQNEELFKSVISKHLNAVTTKDLKNLKSTMSPKGNMELIQPSSEIVYSVDGFMKFHQEWFSIPDWTFKTKILYTD